MKIRLIRTAYSSFLRQTVACRLYELFFLVFIFLFASCTSSSNQSQTISSCLTKSEMEHLRHFLNFLMFENYGAFVVFGSKPLCQISLGDPNSPAADAAFQKWFDSLSEDERAKIEAVKSQALKASRSDLELRGHYYQGWLALNKAMKTLKMKNYLFRVVPLQCPDAYEVVLINIQQTALVLSENYEIFREATGMDFHPLQVVFDAQDPDSAFWKNVFAMQNHVAKGLLFGFGLKNSLFGSWQCSIANDSLILPSEKYQQEIYDYLENVPIDVSTDTVSYGEGSLSNFSIPLFGLVPGDNTAKKYRKEKKMIKKIYQNNDVVETTLQGLASP